MSRAAPFTAADFTDRPFGLPAGHSVGVNDMVRAPIVLDLPVPKSVNNSRRINWSGMPAKQSWLKEADALVMAKGRLPPAIIGPWTMVVTMNEDRWRLDPDNGLKDIIDFCRRLELIENDSPRFAREITLRWGEAPEGCRVTIRPAA